MTPNNLTRAEAAARARLLDVVLYDIELDLDDQQASPSDNDTFHSRTRVVFNAREPGAETWIDLTCERVHSAVLNGVELVASTWLDGSRLRLPELADCNELVVEAQMKYMRSGEGLHRFVDPVDDSVYVYTQFEPFDAHRMYACFDQPDLKATFRFTVRAPEDWVCVSNGAGTNDGGRWTFAETPRMSTYITALVAGPYASVHDEHDGIPLGIYCRRSLIQHLDPDDLFTVTKQGFDFYHRVFGYRYPFGKYDQLFVPEFLHGAMENAGAVTIAESALFRSKVTDAAYERRAMTVLHEMAHMWFGDLVTMRWWDDLWLNESFAAYMSVLCQVEATRYTNGWTTFANTEKTWACRQDQLPSTHPVTADMADIDAVKVNFDGITYAKGASVLKQLVAWVGQDAFLSALSSYFREHEYGNTVLGDLVSALERASGRELGDWSAEWLETAGVNTLRASFETDSDGAFTAFSILQDAPEQWPTLRSHRVAVGLYDLIEGRLVRTHRAELDVVGAETGVRALLGRQQPDLVLVNDDDLTYGKVRLDPTSLRTLVQHVGVLSEPLPRALCWTAAWDMTRDGEMAARDYVALVRRGIGRESDIGIVQSLLRQAQTALELYADPSRASAGLASLASDAFAGAAKSAPGSDLQLAWARTAIATASTTRQISLLRSLLDGSESIPGLAIDTELRWTILQRLVAIGEADVAHIEAEADADPSATGRLRATSCRAALPSAAAKADAWTALLGADGLSNAEQAALVSGFVQREQSQLLSGYVEPYFQVLGHVWEQWGAQAAQGFVLGLYPGYLVTRDVVDRVDQHLAADIPAGLARLLVEARDETVRALTARQRDAAAS